MRFWLQTLGLLAVMVVGFEVACRLFIGTSPAIRVDPRYDRITAPGQWIVQSREGWSRGRTNQLGHLDAPMPAVPPPDGILVIGDSFTEARQVAMAQRFTEQLQNKLGRRVYNVGHTAWSPLHAIAVLETDKARFASATTIIQVSGPDLADIVAKKGVHVVETAGTFAIERPKRKPRGLTRFVERSAFASLVVDRATAILGGAGDDGDAPIAACRAIPPLAKRALPWIVRELHRLGGDVHLLYLPKLDYHAGCVDRCADARELFRAVAAAEGVPFVDTTGAICARFAATRQPLHGFWNTVPGEGHLNAEGHAVVAETLARHLYAGPR